jgi:hypothetical protein
VRAQAASAGRFVLEPPSVRAVLKGEPYACEVLVFSRGMRCSRSETRSFWAPRTGLGHTATRPAVE